MATCASVSISAVQIAGLDTGRRSHLQDNLIQPDASGLVVLHFAACAFFAARVFLLLPLKDCSRATRAARPFFVLISSKFPSHHDRASGSSQGSSGPPPAWGQAPTHPPRLAAEAST
jgi:hypothetical protein